MEDAASVLIHLKSMWAPQVKRSTQLIVDVSYKEKKGCLHNPDWAFEVPYAFRDALDLSYDQRLKNKIPYMVWTQGPVLKFKEGDVFHEKSTNNLLQVGYATTMGWDTQRNEMFQGIVNFTTYQQKTDCFHKLDEGSLNQMDFLALLING